MKKIIPPLVVIILVLSGFGAVGFTSEKRLEEKKFVSESVSLSFSQLNIKDFDSEYVEIYYEDSSSFFMEPGRPMLPKIVKVFELPLGVKDVNVEVIAGAIEEVFVDKEVRPSPKLQPLAINGQATSYCKIKKDFEIYNSNKAYPKDWYNFKVSVGLNSKNKRVTQCVLHLYPTRYIPAESKILISENIDVKISYKPSDYYPKSTDDEYDMVIIAPRIFTRQLQRLVNHKNSIGVKTFIKTTESIYKEYNKRDKPEEIKYFIKDALDNNNIKYVLLMGGLNSQIYAKPRDDTNQGSKDWYVPVRYTNLFDNPKFPLDAASGIHDPGVICDLYYADIYGEGEVFQTWDPNEDGIFAAWNKPDDTPDDPIEEIDMKPDVCLGRLACRSIKEVKTLVDKIINYEKNTYGKEWFNKMTVVSGDGFLDQEDWNIQWDTTGYSGHFTIYAQSINDELIEGPVDTIPITIDRSQETNLNFNHDDNLNPALANGYPAPPIAEIVSVSKNDILGFSDYTYTPREGEAYGNDFMPWANLSYVDGILTIRGKSYDPQAYGNVTNLHVWIKDINGDTIFSTWKNNLEMYYEGEWTTGEKSLLGRGGALYYMNGFEKDILWSSNGQFTGMTDVIEGLNKGAGFLFLSGHGSPNSWGDHYPGVPGNRGGGSLTGLIVTRLKPTIVGSNKPYFPMDTLSNKEKLPVAVIGGCHNSQFNVSMIMGIYDLLPSYFKFLPKAYMWCYGTPVPECFSWRLVRNPNGGAIASMGNTGLGYGMPGKVLTIGGGDGWITIEFFRQYGEHGQHILGEAYAQTLSTYINEFDMGDLESGHTKTVQQWVLFGDPSLQIGGIEPSI